MVLEEGKFSPAAGRTLPSPTTSRGSLILGSGIQAGGQQTSPGLLAHWSALGSTTLLEKKSCHKIPVC